MEDKEKRLKALKNFLMSGEIKDAMSEEEADRFISELKDPEWYIETEEEIIDNKIRDYQHYSRSDDYDNWIFKCLDKLSDKEIKEAIESKIIYEVHTGDFKEVFNSYCDDIKIIFLDNYILKFPLDTPIKKKDLTGEAIDELEKIAYGAFNLDEINPVDFYNEVLLDHDISKVRLSVYDKEYLKSTFVDYGRFILNIQSESLADFDMGAYYDWNYKETYYRKCWNVNMAELLSYYFEDEILNMLDDYYYLGDGEGYYIDKDYFNQNYDNFIKDNYEDVTESCTRKSLKESLSYEEKYRIYKDFLMSKRYSDPPISEEEADEIISKLNIDYCVLETIDEVVENEIENIKNNLPSNYYEWIEVCLEQLSRKEIIEAIDKGIITGDFKYELKDFDNIDKDVDLAKLLLNFTRFDNQILRIYMDSDFFDYKDNKTDRVYYVYARKE